MMLIQARLDCFPLGRFAICPETLVLCQAINWVMKRLSVVAGRSANRFDDTGESATQRRRLATAIYRHARVLAKPSNTYIFIASILYAITA